MKKFLLSLCVGFLGIISFCSATVYDSYSGHCNNKDNFCIRLRDINLNGCNGNYYLLLLTTGDTKWELRLPTNGFMKSSTDSFFGQAFSCSNYEFSFIDRSTNGFDYVLKFVDYDEILNIGNSGGGSCPECPTCPEVNTGEILSGYILESEIDTNYCVGNGLCPNECGSGTDMSGDLQYSNLFINNILHPGTENIFLNIQDNIFWDYSESESGLIIDVGSGYDQDYIDGVIDVQSYRPTSEDFTQTFVGGLILFTPYVVILLFVILVWNLIKKIFKTK